MGKRKKTSSSFSLKDHLFNRPKVMYLAERFESSDQSFDGEGFVQATMKGFKKLELKERIVHIAGQLESFLPDHFPEAAKQIVNALPPPMDPDKSDDDFGDFIFAPLGEYVVRNGMDKEHLKLSLETLQQLTMRFSMEDAIRAFINQHTEETLKHLNRWTKHPNYHVRRLVSEGTRPLLPWSPRLNIETTRGLPLLDKLHADRTRYVTRSVANHLNDIAKSEPQSVIETLKRWREGKSQDPNELQWMTKHSLRTLIKQGDKRALALLGFRANPKIEIDCFGLENDRIKPGQTVEFSFRVMALRKEALLIDYVIDFVKANGKRSPKVHKLKQIELAKGESATVSKRHRLHANATTYTLYPGTHHITLQINGKEFGTRSFELL